MDDLISRATVIAEVEQWAEHGYEVLHWTGIKAMLEVQPAVDAVPVVRCRNCKYSDVIYDTTLDTMPLKCLDIRYGGVMPDWYCEHGERRDDNGNCNHTA